MNSVGSGYCPGTCGELVQGFTASGEPFHITLPINLGSRCRIVIEPGPGALSIAGRIGVKVRAALETVAATLGLHTGTIWTEIDSQLPVGRGMASSTADIVAAIRACCDAVGKTLDPGTILGIATAIESSDGCAHSGIVAINQKNGRIFGHVGDVPDMTVVICVPSRIVETANVALRLDDCFQQQQLLDEFLDVPVPSASFLGQLATRSGALNQRDNPNPIFDRLHPFIAKLGAVGLAVGHTGSVVGVLFEPSRPTDRALSDIKDILADFPERIDFLVTSLDAGNAANPDRVTSR